MTAAVASRWQFLWWADPAGGILISAVIIWRWCVITAGSVAKVVSRGAGWCAAASGACVPSTPGRWQVLGTPALPLQSLTLAAACSPRPLVWPGGRGGA